MSILIIGPNEERAIAEALARARANPIPLRAVESIGNATASATLPLSDRKPGVDFVRQRFEPVNVMLGTYRAAISFEHQPIGLCKHLSVSSHHAKKIPGLEVMQMISEAFGFSGFPIPPDRGRAWLEEFEPGRHAVNIVELESETATERDQGHG